MGLSGQPKVSQAWVPPAWALFGATLAVFRFGIASYWVNGYYGGCLAALGGALLLELLIALLGTGLKGITGHGAGYSPGPRTFGTPAYIGQLLLTRFLLVFEVASFLLLVAAVGAVVLARRRGGIDEQDGGEAPGPVGLALPRDAGSMAEGVGRPLAPAQAHAERVLEARARAPQGSLRYPRP